jgi:hypothetical protein
MSVNISYISEDMKWSTHINNAEKASSTLGFLRRNLKYSPKNCKKTAYITLVRSIMDYGGCGHLRNRV